MSVEDRKKKLAEAMRAKNIENFSYTPGQNPYETEILNASKTETSTETENDNEQISEPKVKHFNPIDPKQKNKYQLVEEYFTLCDKKGITPFISSEIKKKKVKELEDEIKRISKLPDIKSKPKSVQKQYSNAGEHFYNMNWFFAYQIENLGNKSDRVEIDNMKDKIKDQKEPLIQIGSELFEENPEMLQYLNNPWIKLGLIWTVAAGSSIKFKPKEEIVILNTTEEKKKEI